MTETFLGSAGAPPIEPGGWPALRRAVARACERFPADLARASAGGSEVVLLGGSAVNLACLDLGLARFDHARAEGHRLPARVAGDSAERLARMTLEERCALPIERERAAILPAGLACLAGALERIGATGARTSSRGLRYGLARELLGARRA
jgi:exopolyphosphatase/pppGpp-phosphohydrolase